MTTLSQKPLGIIDTLGEGFAAINRHLWILILPVLLDLLFAFGPGVSVAPLTQRATAAVEQAMTEGLPADDASEVQGRVADTARQYGDANLLGILAWQLPSLVNATSPVGLPKLTGPLLAELDSSVVTLGYGLGLGLLGLAGASFYLAGLASAVRRELGRAGLVARSGQVWLRLATLVGLVVVLSIPATMLSVLVMVICGSLSPALVSFFGSLLLAGAMLLGFYAYFLSDAIALVGLWPVPALLASAQVVGRHFWASLGFILLVTVINTGIPLAWRVITGNPAGLVVAIVGHAYISSGLAAAAMFFFWQRLQLILAAGGGAPLTRREAQ